MVTTTSLAQENLRQARAAHARAQADNVRCKNSMATRGLLSRAEVRLALAEQQAATARTVALTQPAASGRRLVAR